MIFILTPVSVLAMHQDSLTVFKQKKLSVQHDFLKEQLNSIKNVEVFITVFLDRATKKKDTSYIAKSYYFKNRVYRNSKVYTKAHTTIALAQRSKKDSLLGSFFHDNVFFSINNLIQNYADCKGFTNQLLPLL